MVAVVSDISTVPVGADLTAEDLSLAIVKGFETMNRVDKQRVAGAQGECSSGEWMCLDAAGKAVRPSATPVPATYLVFCGTDRFDSKATGQVTLIMSSTPIVKTSKYDTTATYAVGDYLTVKDLGGGEAIPTKASSGEVELAKVQEVGAGYLVYEVLSN